MYGTVPKSWAGAVCVSVQGPRTGKEQEYWQQLSVVERLLLDYPEKHSILEVR